MLRNSVSTLWLICSTSVWFSCSVVLESCREKRTYSKNPVIATAATAVIVKLKNTV